MDGRNLSVKVCPHCAEELPDAAKVCPECHKDPAVAPASAMPEPPREPEAWSSEDARDLTGPATSAYKNGTNPDLSPARFIFLVLVAIVIVLILRAAGLGNWVW